MTTVPFYVVCFKTHVGVSLTELALFFRDPAVSGYPDGSQLPFSVLHGNLSCFSVTQKARVHKINFYSNSGHTHAVLGCAWGVCCSSWGLSFLSLLVCFFVVFSLFPAGRLAHLACAGFFSLSLCLSLDKDTSSMHIETIKCWLMSQREE